MRNDKPHHITRKYLLLLVVFLCALTAWQVKEYFFASPPQEEVFARGIKKTNRAVKDAVFTKENAKSYGRYTLLSFQYSTNVYLVNLRGKIVHRWSAPFRKLWPDASHVHKLARARIFVETAHVYPNGDLLVQYSGLGDTPYGYGLAKIDKDSNLIWKYSENVHHDFYVRPGDGHIFTLTQSMAKSPLPGLEKIEYPILSDYIVELSAEGKELNKISIAEAFLNTPYQPYIMNKRKAGKGKWDILHTNSVMALDSDMAKHFPMLDAGDILVSIRNMNLLAIIDGKTGKITHGYTGSWLGQHSASFADNGNLLLLDNLGPKNQNRKPADRQSRVIEISPETGAIAWSYSGTPDNPFKSPARGRAERLPNGNTLIADSIPGRVYEVTSDGEVVWRMQLVSPSSKKKRAKGHLWVITAKRYTGSDVAFIKEKKP